MTVSILAAMRSPFAEADGVLAGWHPVDLSVEIADAAITRAGVTAASVDHVWVGCDEPVGAQGANLARAIVLAVPHEVVDEAREALRLALPLLLLCLRRLDRVKAVALVVAARRPPVLRPLVEAQPAKVVPAFYM